jgi:hypothetical protein
LGIYQRLSNPFKNCLELSNNFWQFPGIFLEAASVPFLTLKIRGAGKFKKPSTLQKILFFYLRNARNFVVPGLQFRP